MESEEVMRMRLIGETLMMMSVCLRRVEEDINNEDKNKNLFG